MSIKHVLWRLWFAILVLGFVLTPGCGGSGSPAAPPALPTPGLRKPNFILIVTDDLDVATWSMVPRLQALAAEGVSFSRAYVTQALCAPSRASIFTGQYPHNHGAVHNGDGFREFFMSGEASTLAVWLKRAGYRTGLIGKYLNGYPGDVALNTYIPPGWDEWQGRLTTESARYFNYTVNENVSVVSYGARQEDYDTDVIARRAADFVKQAGGQPFFLYLAPQAPHDPATYANRHGGEFVRLDFPRAFSFNEADISDKPAWLQGFPLLTATDIRRLDQFEQARLRSMLAVCDLIDLVTAALAETGELSRTYIVFTSDNGLHLGEHRISRLKGTSYEEAVRVPLTIRGPGIASGVSRDDFVMNLDLAPTVMDLANLLIPESVDGRSFVQLLAPGAQAPTGWRTDVLVETYSLGVTAALRNRDYLYVEVESGEVELYEMKSDPSQMQSLHRRADRTLLDALSKRVKFLRSCRGTTCRQ